MSTFDLDSTQNRLSSETGDVVDWCNKQYEDNFAMFFKDISTWYSQVVMKKNRLTDDQLELIITSLPLQIIEVSEKLSAYKLNNECLKLYMKKLESEYIEDSDLKTMSAKKENAYNLTLEYRMLSQAYSSVISRVDNQINFARELIMSSKKIWDSRNKVYNASPIESAGLEDYTYIK